MINKLVNNLKNICLKIGVYFILICLIFYISYENAIQQYASIVFVLISLYTAFSKKYIKNDSTSLILFTLSISLMNIFYHKNFGGVASAIVLSTAPYAFYFSGIHIVRKIKDEEQLLLISLCFLFAIVFPFVNLAIENVQMTGNFINVSRILNLNENQSLSATVVGMTISMGIAGIGVFLMRKSNIIVSVLFLLLTLFTLFVNIHIVNRTAIIAFIICLFSQIIYFSRTNKLKIVVTFSILVAIYFIIMSLFDVNTEINDAYSNRMEEGNTSDFGGRYEIWIKAIGLFFSNPLGWSQTEGFSHNLWLDVAREGGIIPFVFLVIFTFQVYRRSFKLFSIKENSFICLLIGINVVTILYAFMEPIYQGSKSLFYACCLFWGMQYQLLKYKI